MAYGRLYTEAEKNLIRRLYPTTPAPVLARRLNRTSSSVHMKAWLMGIKAKQGIAGRPGVAVEWSKREIRFLKANWKSMTSVQLAKAIGKRRSKVREMCYHLDLRKIEMEYWTPQQVRFLKRSYQKVGDVELAEIFESRWPKHKEWTRKHIGKKRRYLKLKRSKRQQFLVRLRNIDQGRMHGLRWDNLIRRQVRIGTVIVKNVRGIDGKVYPTKLMRVKGDFINYRRYVWEKNFGPIPRGHVVAVKDGNPLNTDPRNLECITRKTQAERMHRSDGAIAGYLALKKIKPGQGKVRIDRELYMEILKHPELIEAKRAQLKLQRALKGRRKAA